MLPIAHIRKNVFDGMSQATFGQLAGTTQATVSRWEAGELEPDREQLRRIRNEALRLGRPWDDSWFFEVPEAASS